MSFQISANRNRTVDFSGVLYLSDGTTPITTEVTDVIRFKIGRRNLATPVLDIDSVAATAAGSIVAFTPGATGAYTVRVAQGDTVDLLPGVYDCEVLLVDDSETSPPNAIKSADTGVLHLFGALAGDIGQT